MRCLVHMVLHPHLCSCSAARGQGCLWRQDASILSFCLQCRRSQPQAHDVCPCTPKEWMWLHPCAVYVYTLCAPKTCMHAPKICIHTACVALMHAPVRVSPVLVSIRVAAYTHAKVSVRQTRCRTKRDLQACLLLRMRLNGQGRCIQRKRLSGLGRAVSLREPGGRRG